jgi:hypothetical protein
VDSAKRLAAGDGSEPKTWQVFPNRPGLVASKPNQ